MAGPGELTQYRDRSTEEHCPEENEVESESERADVYERVSLDSQSHEELFKLAMSHYDLFRKTGRVRNIDKAIGYGALAINIITNDHSELPSRLSSLGLLYTERYRRLGKVDDIEQALECGSRALELTPNGHPNLPDRLASLALSYEDRYRLLGEVGDLDKSLEYDARALNLTPDRHPKLPDRLANLAVSYWDRYRLLGGVGDLDKSLEYNSRALSLTPDGHPNLPDRLANLAVSYGDRYGLLGEIGDLDKSLEYNSRALSLTPNGNLNLPDWLANLAVSYSDRYRLLGEVGDLDKSLEYSSRALSLTPNDHPDLPDRLANLAVSYGDRYGLFGEVGDLDKSLEYSSRAASLTPNGHPNLPDRLASLAVSYTDRYGLLGDVSDLDKSLEYKSRALSLTPDGHPNLPDRLASLAVSYGGRYGLLGEVGDLDKSLEYNSRALNLTPDRHPKLPDRLASLALSYEDRYRLLDEVGDLDKSLEYRSRALSLTPDRHPKLPDRLANLAVSYGDRYRLLGDVGDLDKSLEYKSRALSLTPNGHPQLPDRLVNLAVSYSDRYRLLGEVGDLDKSLEYNSSAIRLTPHTHPNLSWLHYNQALYRIDQYRHTGHSHHLISSLNSFRTASNAVATPPRERFQRAFVWAKEASKHTSLNLMEAFQATINLLPQFVWLGAATTQRYHDLSLAENLAVRAASAAILHSDYHLALEWLEHARCVVWNQSVMLRSPLDLLAPSHPELASRLQTAANQLHQASSSRPSGLPAPVSGSDALQVRHCLAREYNNLLAHARQFPGFEDLLRPTKSKALVRAARYGPIVVINCHEDHCDALIVLPESDVVEHLPLPDFTEVEAQRAQSEMEMALQRKGLRERGVRRREEAGPDLDIQRVLAEIWTGIVKPVLDFLGYTNRVSSSNLSHITWCPAGAISFLPLHAAGDYDQPGSRVFDYVISSYTPTLTAYLAAIPHTLSCSSRVLAVGQEATLGHNPLPGTIKELAYIKAHVENVAECTQLVDDQATPTSVLDAMERHDWVHLACHAHQNASDPTQSGFFLHNGTLDLTDINRRSFRKKGLAFLSACQTAKGDEKLPDEAIHLASGMLMVGYASVIATMWSVNDSDAPIVADGVYGQLMKEGKVGNGEAGRALHHAVAELRDKVGEKNFGRWVPYIHIGT